MISTIIFGALGIGVGLMLAFWHNVVMALIFIVFGILTLLSGVSQLVSALKNIGSGSIEAMFDLIMSIVTVCMGLVLIFLKNGIVMLVAGIYLIIFPIIRVLIAKEKLFQLKAELPSMILGVALVVLGPLAVDIVFKIIGAVVIALSVMYMVFGIIATVKLNKRIAKSTTGTRIFADTNGDGNIDTVYIDTDGDGKHDSTIHINIDKESE